VTDEQPPAPDAPDEVLDVADDEVAAEDPPARPSLVSRVLTPSGAGELTDPEVGRRMRTLDPTERRFGFIGAGFILVLSLLFIPSLLHTTYGKPTTKPTDGKCPDGYRLVAKTCETIYHPSDFIIQFLVLLALGLVLLFAVWRSKRSLTIFLALFVGLGSLFVQVPVVFLIGTGLGVWLLVRSWRLQRYGTTDGKVIRREAIARNEAKRDARKAGKAGKAADPVVTGRSSVAASKRYTPKTKPPRR
jgi:hypothetical protein